MSYDSGSNYKYPKQTDSKKSENYKLSEGKYLNLSNLVFGYHNWVKSLPEPEDEELKDDSPGTYFATPEAVKIINQLFLPQTPHTNE